MKGVFDLQILESCVAYNNPPLLVLVVGDDCEMQLQAPNYAEAKTWLKFFLIASPNCRVSFKQDSSSGFGTPSVGARSLESARAAPGSSSPLVKPGKRELGSAAATTEHGSNSAAAASAAAAVAVASASATAKDR